MRVRSLTSSGDWSFGAGVNNYSLGNIAIAQNIQTRLMSFLGNCFFDTGAGIDWFNLLGNKNQTALNLAISAVILNTDDVTGILQLSVSLTTLRVLSVSYNVQTIYSTTSNTFGYDFGSLS